MKRADFRKDPEAYFWHLVQKSPDENGCWLWQRARNTMGYGQTWWIDNKVWLVHRLAWTITNGPIPKGLYVCHRCDNPLCVRPDHMFVGTQFDNMADMRAKGREFHPPPASRRLTPDDVREIRQRFRSGERVNQIARAFNHAHGNISQIVNGKVWTHVKD